MNLSDFRISITFLQISLISDGVPYWSGIDWSLQEYFLILPMDFDRLLILHANKTYLGEMTTNPSNKYEMARHNFSL